MYPLLRKRLWLVHALHALVSFAELGLRRVAWIKVRSVIKVSISGRKDEKCHLWNFVLGLDSNRVPFTCTSCSSVLYKSTCDKGMYFMSFVQDCFPEMIIVTYSSGQLPETNGLFHYAVNITLQLCFLVKYAHKKAFDKKFTDICVKTSRLKLEMGVICSTRWRC
jgi:hypothetical protein